MANRLNIPKSEIEQGMPIRVFTAPMLSWMAGLEVWEAKRYPLPGGQEKRTFAPDPRLNLKTMVTGSGVNLSPKDSDVVTYYETVAVLHHACGVFVAFQMTMDALLAMQKDPQKFPAWLMKDRIKKTELQVHFMVMTGDPRSAQTINDWLTPIEDIYGNQAAEWMYDALSYYVTSKGVLKESFFKKD